MARLADDGMESTPYLFEICGEKMGHKALLGDHVVGPFNQGHEYCGVAKLRSIVVQVRFGDASGTGARAAGVDLNMFGGELVERFAYGRPSNRRYRVGERLSHQYNRFAQQVNLHLVSGFRESESMRKGKRRLGWIVGTPCALHQDLERLVRGLSLQSATSHRER